MVNFKIGAIYHPDNALEVQTAIRAFSDFFEELTPKHKSRVSFQVLSEAPCPVYVYTLGEVAAKIDWKEVNTSINSTLCLQLFDDVNLFLLMRSKSQDDFVRESLKRGMPVISFLGNDTTPLVNISCGISMRPREQSSVASELTEHFENIYFDEAAHQLMCKNAIKRANEALRL